MPPTLANGRICYIEMPAADIARSATSTSGSRLDIRKRGDAALLLTMRAAEVSGTWVLGARPQQSPASGFISWLTAWPRPLTPVVAQGGEIVQPIGADAPEITARFRDPGGNVIGLYQQPA